MACENYYSSSVINNSNSEILLCVKGDRVAIKKLREEYIKKGLLVRGIEVRNYQVKIKPSESFQLDGRLHTPPDFYNIKEIEIYSGDTLILKCRKDQMMKLFSSKINPGSSDLIIK